METGLQLFGGILIFIIGIFFIYAARSLAPWVPSSARMAARGLTEIHAAPPQKFVDLGCGDGRIVFMAAKKFNLDAVGYEISLLPYLIAKLRMLVTRNAKAHIYFKNIFETNLSGFDIIYVYGLPKSLNSTLLPKLTKEMKPGTYLLSYNFHLEGKEPHAVIRETMRSLYIYQF